MNVTIQKRGNSQSIRIPKKLLKLLDLKENDVVNIETKDSSLVIKKKSPYIMELFSKKEEYYGLELDDWGEDMGEENYD